MPLSTVTIGCTFADAGRIRARLDTVAGARVEAEAFTAGGARLTVAVPQTSADSFIRMVTDMTRGHASIDQADG